MEEKEILGNETLIDWFRKNVIDNEARAYLEKNKGIISKAYKKLLEGYDIDASKIIKGLKKNNSFHGLVHLKDIPFTSIFLQYFFPCTGKISIIYEPEEILMEFSEIYELVQVLSHKVHTQESLCQEIGQEIMSSGKAKGAYISSECPNLPLIGKNLDSYIKNKCSCALGTLSGSEHGTN